MFDVPTPDRQSLRLYLALALFGAFLSVVGWLRWLYA